MNVLIVLERGGENKSKQRIQKKISVKTTKSTGEHDKFTKTRRVEPITLCNKCIALESGVDSDDEVDDDDTNDNSTDKQVHKENLSNIATTRHSPQQTTTTNKQDDACTRKAQGRHTITSDRQLHE